MPSDLSNYRPGDVVMNAKQYNQLLPLMRVQRQGGKADKTVWNGIPVHVNNTLPTAGWFIVPGEHYDLA